MSLYNCITVLKAMQYHFAQVCHTVRPHATKFKFHTHDAHDATYICSRQTAALRGATGNRCLDATGEIRSRTKVTKPQQFSFVSVKL